MDYALRFAQLASLWWTVASIACAMFAYRFIPRAWYVYPLAGTLAAKGLTRAPTHKRVFWLLRILVLVILALLIAKPQLVDLRSSVQLEGIDIVIVLDASASMQFQDYDDDQRSRFQVAKDEALRFVDKRIDDAFGLVLFGKDALSRIPLTMDKKLIHTIISGLELGFIDPDGTVLANGIITAANRLKNSQAKSKIMIVLTDGAPSDHDADPAIAIELAQKLGIKIYTIGIGSDEDQYIMHPFMGLIPKPKINRPLLVKIAQETGGNFFLARNSKDMRAVYDTIDQLEKTTRDTSLYNTSYDIFVPGVVVIIILLLFELLLSSTIWFGI